MFNVAVGFLSVSFRIYVRLIIPLVWIMTRYSNYLNISVNGGRGEIVFTRTWALHSVSSMQLDYNQQKFSQSIRLFVNDYTAAGWKSAHTKHHNESYLDQTSFDLLSNFLNFCSFRIIQYIGWCKKNSEKFRNVK